MQPFQALPGLADILARYEDQRQQDAVRSGLERLSGGFEPYLPNLLGSSGLPTTPTYPIPNGIDTPSETGTNTPYTGPTDFQPLARGRYPIQDRTPEPLPNPSVVAPEIQRVAAEAWARWPGLTNMGTYNVRNIAGTNTLSEHSYGDAIDIGGTPEEMSQLATWASRKAAELGITQVIYQDAIWTSDQGWHPYTGVPHTNHVHITGPQTYSDTSPSFPVTTWHPPKRKPARTTGRTLATTRRQRL